MKKQDHAKHSRNKSDNYESDSGLMSSAKPALKQTRIWPDKNDLS